MSLRRNPNINLPDVMELAEWHEANIASLRVYKTQVLEARVNPKISVIPKFRGLQEEEIDEIFELIEDEVKKLFLFSILSITEGNIRKDFFERIKNALSQDVVSKKYKKLRDKAGSSEKVRMIHLETLMEIWKDKFADQRTKNKIGGYKTALKFRHWVAHGRYFPFNFHTNYEPNRIALECADILKLIPLTKV